MIVRVPAPSPPIRAALGRHGLAPRRIVLISPLGERKGRRLAYRVETTDGQIVKAREFECEGEAHRVVELRAGLEEAFAPVLARYGAVLIEEWIEGVPLIGLDWESWVADAGALFGRLHASAPREPATVSTRAWVEAADSDLLKLVAAGALDTEDASRVRAGIRRHDPGVARTSLVHMDFCADNMLIDATGRLRVIDNEQFAISPAGLDLGRTFHLWPMTAGTWRRFDRAYRSSAPAAPAATEFWRLIATLLGARVFLNRSPARLDASLALLRRLSGSDEVAEQTLTVDTMTVTS